MVICVPAIAYGCTALPNATHSRPDDLVRHPYRSERLALQAKAATSCTTFHHTSGPEHRPVVNIWCSHSTASTCTQHRRAHCAQCHRCCTVAGHAAGTIIPAAACHSLCTATLLEMLIIARMPSVFIQLWLHHPACTCIARPSPDSSLAAVCCQAPHELLQQCKPFVACAAAVQAFRSVFCF